MILMCDLTNQGLYGNLTYEQDAYLVRVYRVSDIIDYGHLVGKVKYPSPIYYMSFGNGVQAEDRLIDLLENPAWTLLKYG